MKDARYNYAYQVENAKRMAKEHNRPVRVFHVYMPSVYRVDRSPLNVEPMPSWHDGRQEEWIKDNIRMAATVVLTDGTVLEPVMKPMAAKPKKQRVSKK